MSKDETSSCLAQADRAKLSLTLAYGISSLFYMFLKTQGVSPKDHPVKEELDRIRAYMGRLKTVGAPAKERNLKVDKEASRRFIENALAGDNVWRTATKGPKPQKLQNGGEDGRGGKGHYNSVGEARESPGHGSWTPGSNRKRKREGGELDGDGGSRALTTLNGENQEGKATGVSGARKGDFAGANRLEQTTPQPIFQHQWNRSGNKGKGKAKGKGKSKGKAFEKLPR
ncbi:unnamed protein product [Choristocarpus tenellus]